MPGVDVRAVTTIAAGGLTDPVSVRYRASTGLVVEPTRANGGR